MVKFALLPFALTLLLALPIRPVFAAADPDDLVREAVQRLGLQTEMPAPKLGRQAEVPAPQSAPPAEMPSSKSGPQAEAPPPPSANAPDVNNQDQEPNSLAVPDVIRFLLWGAVIAGTLVIVWSLRDSLPVISRSRKIIAPEPARPPLTPSNRMEEAQLEADDLARQGHYREAMHLLLLKSLTEIRRQLGTSFAISLTSREILRRVQLSDIARQSLSAIIRSVERTYFGGGDAGQRDYSDCRTNFETFKRSLTTVDAT
jgi:hypothetical protein